MIEAGDKVMVCLSGGKDSHALLDLLISLRERAPVPFDLVAVNLDQKQPGFPAHVLPDYLARRGVPFHIENQDTYSVVKKLVPEGATMCSLCSRLRRGILYRVAGELGATKIALGHHRDDMVVTLLINMFFGGRLKGMPPKLVSDDGRHVVIRPLAYVAETDLERWAEHRRFPIIPCTLCGSQNDLQRVQIKQMLREWERQYPGRSDNMLRAMAHVMPLAPAGPQPVSLRHAAQHGAWPMPAATRPSTTSLAPRRPLPAGRRCVSPAPTTPHPEAGDARPREGPAAGLSPVRPSARAGPAPSPAASARLAALRAAWWRCGCVRAKAQL